MPGTNKFIHIPRQQYNGLSWESAIHQVQQETPFAITPLSLFSPHYANVCAAMKRRNPATLYDGAGEPFSKARKEDLIQQRTTDIAILFDTSFKKRQGAFWLAENHRLVQGKLQPQTKQRVQRCVKGNNVLVDLVFNAQGLPTRKSGLNDYKLGKTLYFFEPEDNCYAGFVAGSGGADLYCYGGPRGSSSRLGVLLYAEGVAKK